MDLDQNGHTAFAEAQAYFAANNYLICRPIRSQVISRHLDILPNLELQVASGYAALFKSMNANRDWNDPQKLDEDDLLLFQESLTNNTWDQRTKTIFKNICTSQHVINQINDLPEKTADKSLFWQLDTDSNGALS